MPLSSSVAAHVIITLQRFPSVVKTKLNLVTHIKKKNLNSLIFKFYGFWSLALGILVKKIVIENMGLNQIKKKEKQGFNFKV
jgi:hypothetical protein